MAKRKNRPRLIKREHYLFVNACWIMPLQPPVDGRGALTPQSRFGNWLSCLLMRLLWGVEYTDLGPFRAIAYPALELLDMRDPDYGWTVEMQIKSAIKGLGSTEVPVSYRRRIGTSKISGTVRGVVFAGIKILYTIFRSARHLSASPRRQERQRGT